MPMILLFACLRSVDSGDGYTGLRTDADGLPDCAHSFTAEHLCTLSPPAFPDTYSPWGSFVARRFPHIYPPIWSGFPAAQTPCADSEAELQALDSQVRVVEDSDPRFLGIGLGETDEVDFWVPRCSRYTMPPTMVALSGNYDPLWVLSDPATGTVAEFFDTALMTEFWAFAGVNYSVAPWFATGAATTETQLRLRTCQLSSDPTGDPTVYQVEISLDVATGRAVRTATDVRTVSCGSAPDSGIPNQ